MLNRYKIAIRLGNPSIIDHIVANAHLIDERMVLSEKFEVDNCHLIITDVTYLNQNFEEQILANHANKVILISDQNDEYNINKIMANVPIRHIIGSNQELLTNELETSLRKKISNRVFGIEHYLNENNKIFQTSLDSPRDINEIINQAINEFDFSSMFDSPVSYLQMISNELLTNALRCHCRTEDRNIEYRIGKDQDRIIVSTTDHRGLLSFELVTEKLVRAFRDKSCEEKKEGAGLGLFLSFQHSNQLIINYKKNVMTEVICIIDHNKRFKKYRERITSFHFFEEVST